jgi:hypothetical protein
MLQLPLFNDLNPVTARAPALPDAAESIPAAPAIPERADVSGGWLFDPAVILRLSLDEALEDGRFEDARRCYHTLLEQWGPDRSLRAVAFLERLDLDAWDGPVAHLLQQWLDVVPLAGPAAITGRCAWRGLVRRLLDAHAAGALVAASPRCLAPLANALFELSRGVPAYGVQARSIVRDALVGGRDLRPDDFRDDRVRDLLAEPLAPAWLASLGAIRRLWGAPAVDEPAAANLLALPIGARTADVNGAAARSFWDCLRIAWSPVPEALRQEARRRMKRLDPELHRLAMSGRVP